jgi:hypothetical protein
MKKKPKHPFIIFIEYLPVMAVKGFVLFLGFGLILIILNKLLLIPIDEIFELIDQGGLFQNIIMLTIVGAVAHYSFWKT